MHITQHASPRSVIAHVRTSCLSAGAPLASTRVSVAVRTKHLRRASLCHSSTRKQRIPQTCVVFSQHHHPRRRHRRHRWHILASHQQRVPPTRRHSTRPRRRRRHRPRHRDISSPRVFFPLSAALPCVCPSRTVARCARRPAARQNRVATIAVACATPTTHCASFE